MAISRWFIVGILVGCALTLVAVFLILVENLISNG